MRVTPIGKNFNKHKVGDEFTVPDAAGRVLIRIGKVREVTQDIAAEEISPRTGKPKRAYRRRDMQAES